MLLVDWPSRDVPDTLARAGFRVFAQEGPERYVAYELSGGEVHPRAVAGPPESVDLVYAYRPLDELPDVVALARSLRATAIWVQSGRDAGGAKDLQGCWLSPDEIQRARRIVGDAGLAFISEPYIADVARASR
ncbi:MAG: CoA-binding protein [bacterium]